MIIEVTEQEIVEDAEGYVYKTVKIGDQWWLAENLKTAKYNNGDPIGTTTPSSLDISGENEPKYQWAYDGNESNVGAYGRLYSWYAVTDNRGICPTGWHVPTDAEWTLLTNFLEGDNIAGGKLKEIGTIHWYSPNTGATNETGFTALPGGYRGGNGAFRYIGGSGLWWSFTESSSSYGWSRTMSYIDDQVGRYNYVKEDGFSVRCLKN
jgi:uncharacterized protein (TIGR02145 family)